MVKSAGTYRVFDDHIDIWVSFETIDEAPRTMRRGARWRAGRDPSASEGAGGPGAAERLGARSPLQLTPESDRRASGIDRTWGRFPTQCGESSWAVSGMIDGSLAVRLSLTPVQFPVPEPVHSVSRDKPRCVPTHC